MAELYKPEPPRSSPVTGPIAALASLIIPGLGQMLALQIWRGLLILVSMASILGLLAWRAVNLATRETGFLAILGKALTRRPFFIGGVLLGVLILWLWNVWDAYQQAAPQRKGGAAIFALILLLFFALGWQISEINLYKAATELSDIWPLLSKVLWPWEAAVTRDTETVMAMAQVQIPCEGPAPEAPALIADQPYIIAAPTCGDLSYMDENNDLVMGTPLHLEGGGFAPHMETQIYWKDSVGQEFHVRYQGEYVNVQTDSAGKFEVDFAMPYRLQPPSAKGVQLHEVQARQVSEIGGLKPSEPLLLSVERMIETIFLGMMATAFGIVFSIPVSFLAAKNLMSGSKLTLSIYYLTRTILNIIRSIEPLIWVIIAAQWVGLGPFAGIIALTVHSVAALAKLYSEAIEGINTGPIEAIEATGATRLQMIMYAVIPQMIPPFVSFSIYRWDINVRMSTIIGLVGGGGIGFLLIQYIRLLNFRAAGIAVWFIAITVALLDYISAEIRERYT
ncbi:MAG: phosphonate ABC transporter, permease protein PhnE [Chloroflexota bacterium]|nr:phosphonate ABC transporter, permease protein PhnE [Chloroflexota bacterium]